MEKNRFIAVQYELYSVDESGKHLREKTELTNTFTFISGFGYTLEEFEKQIVPLAAGENFCFQLKPEQAYGEIEKERILTLDRSIFQINGHFDNDHIYEGADVPMQNEDGMRLDGHVLKVTDDHVIMDFNHPLAGETLEYKGTVVVNRDATDAEIRGFISMLAPNDECDEECDHEHCGGGCGQHHHCGCGHFH